MTVSDDKKEVIQWLRAYRDRIDEIMGLICEKTKLTANEKAQIRAKFTTLKDQLKEDVRRGSTIRGESSLTTIEKQYFMPAVMRASATINTPISANPLTSRMYSELCSARLDITTFLNQLEHPK